MWRWCVATHIPQTSAATIGGSTIGSSQRIGTRRASRKPTVPATIAMPIDRVSKASAAAVPTIQGEALRSAAIIASASSTANSDSANSTP